MKLIPYDTAEYLDTPEAMRAYMAEAIETNDPAFIAQALGTLARAKSMTEIARKTGLSRESLYRSLSAEGRPELGTVLKVMEALDIRLTVQQTARPRAEASKQRGVLAAKAGKVTDLPRIAKKRIVKAKAAAHPRLAKVRKLGTS